MNLSALIRWMITEIENIEELGTHVTDSMDKVCIGTFFLRNLGILKDTDYTCVANWRNGNITGPCPIEAKLRGLHAALNMKPIVNGKEVSLDTD